MRRSNDLATQRAVLRLVLERERELAAADVLVGVCSFWEGELMLPLRGEPLRGMPYINMIGTDRHYQGKKLEEGSRPGDALLRGVLEQIATLYRGPMPHVYALVSPKNTRSHALFERHGFGVISPLEKGGDIIRLRAPG
jgi:ribosomal protein S18 acetylase RimI-like enzyme